MFQGTITITRGVLTQKLLTQEHSNAELQFFSSFCFLSLNLCTFTHWLLSVASSSDQVCASFLKLLCAYIAHPQLLVDSSSSAVSSRLESHVIIFIAAPVFLHFSQLLWIHDHHPSTSLLIFFRSNSSFFVSLVWFTCLLFRAIAREKLERVFMNLRRQQDYIMEFAKWDFLFENDIIIYMLRFLITK